MKPIVRLRIGSVLLVGLLASSLVLATPAVASANVVVSPPPVAEIPDIPSRTKKSATGTALGDVTAIQMVAIWKAALSAAKNGTPTLGSATPAGAVAAVAQPKPITPATTLARGAAGGPLLAAFSGGFAIGTTGLQVYGAITGEDPLDGVCGTPVQGLSSVIYLGMMPECHVPALDPNVDAVASSTLTYGDFRMSYDGVWTSPSGTQSHCLSGTMTRRSNAWRLDAPSGYYIYGTTPLGDVATVTAYVWTGACGTADSADGKAFVYVGDSQPAPPYWIATSRTAPPVATQVDTTADPLRTPSCTIDWTDGTSTSGAGVDYRESEGVPFSSSGLGCKSAWDAKPGAGREVLPDRIGVDSEDESGAKTQIADEDVPEFSETDKIALDPSLGNGRGLVLEKVVDGDVRSCMTWQADCSGWWPATADGTSSTTDTGTYRCSYGGAEIALNECGPYRETFDTKTSTPTITDPDTGESVGWETAPSTGNSINPGVAVGTPAQQCMDQWLDDFNPLDWVLTPVKCALVWAFVPRPEFVTAQQATIADAWAGTGVGKIGNAVSGWAFVPPPNGCEGINVATSQVWPQAEDFRILNACAGEPLQPIAALSATIIGIAAVLGAIFAVTRSFGGVVGYTGLGGGRSD